MNPTFLHFHLNEGDPRQNNKEQPSHGTCESHLKIIERVQVQVVNIYSCRISGTALGKDVYQVPESVQNDLLFKRFAGYLQFAVDAYR
jgi:hypothetical protein